MKEKPRRINWIDMIIIIIIVAVIYISYSFILKPRGIAINKLPVDITFRIEGILPEMAEVIGVGDVFKDKDTNQIIGKVIDKEITEAYDFVETGDGRIIRSKVPGRQSVYITIRGNGVITDDNIRMGDRDMRIEGTIFLKSNISSVESTITDIKINE